MDHWCSRITTLSLLKLSILPQIYVQIHARYRIKTQLAGLYVGVIWAGLRCWAQCVCFLFTTPYIALRTCWLLSPSKHLHSSHHKRCWYRRSQFHCTHLYCRLHTTFGRNYNHSTSVILMNICMQRCRKLFYTLHHLAYKNIMLTSKQIFCSACNLKECWGCKYLKSAAVSQGWWKNTWAVEWVSAVCVPWISYCVCIMSCCASPTWIIN